MWSRTLLIRPDGTRDETTSVTWLQGRTMFADLRQPAGERDPATQEGFAGVLVDDGECVMWQRRVDCRPPSPHPDVGRLWFEGDTLVERGRDIPYVEHWRREIEVPAVECWGAMLRDAEGRAALVVQAGSAFMFARAGTPTEVSLGRVGPDGWIIDRSTLPMREGVVERPATSGDRLIFGGIWVVTELEGDPLMA